MRLPTTLLLSTIIALPLLGCDPMDDVEADADVEQLSIDDLSLPGATLAKRACGYVTHTQNEWGSACAADNAACLRDHDFMTAFPEGLMVGCGVLTANLVTPQAVESALPTGGWPRKLFSHEAVAYDGTQDPKVGTRLFGQVVALGLNLGFDAIVGDPTAPLRGAIVSNPSSPCQGMTVGDVYEEANAALGGCPSVLSVFVLNDCVAAINKSFSETAYTCPDMIAQPPSP